MTSLNIMVVDDSAITIKKLTKILEELGHTVVAVARTGRDAAAMYGSVNPDLVTMDITMPDMDGIEATKLIRKEFHDALIIMVTSHGQEQMVIDAIEAGALGYVIKPVKKEKLQESIDRILDKFWKS
ncbi:Chemotaxis protein CheY [Desulfamplus magnetovallimortis]|uniref:Chemotaxis protein CheY n=1 Tax=Desulfamplus magnetovallimortis TaxID=1246637 RepID=A0A1W1H7J8_9BACT|nr:response regulator [Desulfamplus magnetovallimortis]SLM28348.1 Chemotaxis protein CheY [Desulfamplus magnetovallimortis]